MAGQLLQSSFSRVYLIKNRASPINVPKYEGRWRAGPGTWDQGKITSFFIPDPNQYGKFILAAKIPGEPGLPQLSIDAIFDTDLSELLQMVADQCDHDLQLHFGICKDPSNFLTGWDKIMVLEAARAGSYSSKDFGALEPAHGGNIIETVKFEGTKLYEVDALTFASKAVAQLQEEVTGIVFCDTPQCGTCGVASDGCQVIFAVSKSSGGSPGLLASLIFSTDGGQTWNVDAIDSLAANNAPTGLSCVGPNVIVLSQAANALEWAPIADIENGVETWTQVTTGFVSTKGPNAIVSLGESITYIVGNGGYIYFTADPTSGVVVQDAGSATSQNLNAITAFDQSNLLAVGQSNAVVVTTDGGVTWESITGPTPGANLTCCWMDTLTEWWVGSDTGHLYYTLNAGTTWAEKLFPGSGSGVVRDIKFSSPTVGYLAHSTVAPKGRILRTIDGGRSWYVLPEKVGVMPNNNYLSHLAVCPNVNIVYAGGLATGGVDGIIVAGA